MKNKKPTRHYARIDSDEFIDITKDIQGCADLLCGIESAMRE